MIKKPLKVGIIGTGYAAKKRAESFQTSSYSDLIVVAGNDWEKTQNFAAIYNINCVESWQDLINNFDLDLVCICNINKYHGLMVRKALEAEKHVIVEYPLALNYAEGEDLVNFAQFQKKLLHVEHIEIIGGIHQAILKNLAEIGNPFFARYTTILAQNPAPIKWTYNHDQYGFPFIAALSRIHRFTHLFGNVTRINSQVRFWDSSEKDYFKACLCQAQLTFDNGLIASLVYGKGEVFTSSERILEIQGDKGKLLFEGEKGFLITEKETKNLEVSAREGLFLKDTQAVLEYLINDQPLYINNDSSLYALKIADALWRSP